MVEAGIAIFVVCLPTLWIFSKRSSWTPVLAVAKGISNSSVSNLQLIRSKRSKNSTDSDLGKSIGSYNLEADKTRGS
ncbi:hypothetical protein F5B21DRAFT_476504 [Xylaria acuta]|nr:hypothetical protein F5B21DRAFT_476504 [Xylaria acuta]